MPSFAARARSRRARPRSTPPRPRPTRGPKTEPKKTGLFFAHRFDSPERDRNASPAEPAFGSARSQGAGAQRHEDRRQGAHVTVREKDSGRASRSEKPRRRTRYKVLRSLAKNQQPAPRHDSRWNVWMPFPLFAIRSRANATNQMGLR